MCVHVDCCNDKKKREHERQRALQPDLIALQWVLSLHAQQNVLNYAEEKAD